MQCGKHRLDITTLNFVVCLNFQTGTFSLFSWRDSPLVGYGPLIHEVF